jgi:hypothetical protein
MQVSEHVYGIRIPFQVTSPTGVIMEPIVLNNGTKKRTLTIT